MKNILDYKFPSLKINRHDLTIALITIVVFFAAVPLATYAYFAKDLGSKETIMNRNDTGVVLFDRSDKPFYTLYQGKLRSFVPLNKIPQHMQDAVIASEDKDFYSHPGFSIKSMTRSLIWNIQDNEVNYGGSTITQQLVKNVLLNSRKNFLRKYQEVILAQEIERRYSKKEILEMYLNSVYFGEGSFGIEEASQHYFGKSAQELTISQSALLASLLPAPSFYNPKINPERSKVGHSVVLQKMADQGFITHQQAQVAKEETITFRDSPNDLNNKATHFALMVKDYLIQRYGEEEISRSGFKVKTTIDLKWQDFAQKTVQDQVEKLSPNRVSNGSAVVMNPKTGEVLSLVGSVDWENEEFGKFNITTAYRQPGSSFKPIVYVAALEKRIITPSTVLDDSPITYKQDTQTYSPKDYDGKFRGKVLVRRSLANSLNIPSVQIQNKLGITDTLEMGHRLGLTTLKEPSDYGLSIVLGAAEVKLLELTNVYATFANSGMQNQPTFILEIKDKSNNIIYSYKPNPKKVLDPGPAFQISSILSDNITRSEAFGNALNISRPAAVKTGTTEDYKDAWTLGYTPSLAVGVWVGNNDGGLMDQIAGSLGAAPIWRALMEEFLKGTPVEKFEPPPEVVGLSVCKSNGLRLKEASSSGYTEYFLKGTEPKGFCNFAAPIPQPNTTVVPTVQSPIQNINNGNENKDNDKKEGKN